ncbi:sirtuin [Rickenella mellea]|uniref:Sirtuin n=1 Tax=Rickenella mellea TaxID=50990 RepID=A0A4Y7PSP7_9AGAM|nr:sirtuin [Rickenella mellea]
MPSTSQTAASSDIQAFRDVLASSKSIITLAGAGLSAGSGIQTYRGGGGLWNTHDADYLATPQAFKENPSRVWQFYHTRREICLQSQPNAAHHALASLSEPSTLFRITPSLKETSSPPLLITQNIDSLSLRALDGLPPAVKTAAEGRLLEMHGCIFSTRCTSCQHTQRTYSSPLCSAFLSTEERDIPISELPRCGGENWSGSNRYGKCGGLLRPDVVWFGEIPNHMGEIAQRLNWCDLLLVVGTSSTVYPAAGFAATVKARGGKVAVFDIENPKDHVGADFIFLGPCEETLPEVLGV